MNRNIMYCSDPYASSAEEYYGVDCAHMISPVENLTEKIEKSIQEFVIKYSTKNKSN